LYWYASRWYSPGLSRFLSPDSIIPQPGNPQSWDRYAYTSNNPVNFTDPSGHYLCEDDEKCKQGKPKTSYSTFIRTGLDKHSTDPTINNYYQLRKALFLNFGWDFIDKTTGKIADIIILNLIIKGEFGMYKGKENEAYGEAIEALSMEYFSAGKQTPCAGNCATIGDQITWLRIIKSFTTNNFYDSSFFIYSSDSRSAMVENYQYGTLRESWIWGNYNTGSELDKIIDSGQGKNIYYVVAVDTTNFIVVTSKQNNKINSEGMKNDGEGDYWP
jgi:hypothetical protein